MYNEIINFCDYESSDKKDKYGDWIQERVLSEPVFAKKKSISQTEFYQAQTNGMKPEIKFVIADYLDYNNQQFLIHENVRYKVLKTYQTETNELEITCYGGVRDASTEVRDKN